MSAITLMPHQEEVRNFMVTRPYCAGYLGVGAGKSLTTLMALKFLRPAGHILVIAPVNIARSTWLDEIEKWGFGLRTKSLIVNDNDKKLTREKRLARYAEVFTDPPTMYFISVGLVEDLVKEMPTKNKKIQWPFPTVIIDESQEFKSSSSNKFKALKKVRPAIDRLIELTGTPTPQGLIDLWSQVYLLDQGEALGRTLTAYREKYFYPSMMVDGRAVKWEPHSWAEAEIYAKIAHLAIHVKSQTAPEPIIHDVNVRLTADALKTYKKFARDMVIELAVPGQNGVLTITGESAGIMHNKLLQHASGTLYTGDDHAKDFAQLHSEKLEMTDYLIRNAGGDNVIIAYRYQSDRELLKKHLVKAGHTVEVFDGARETVARWNRGEIGVLLLQPASARHGLNMQDGGHTLIWYTLPDSYEHYHQTNGRLVRKGQMNQVDVYRLIAQNTIDTKMPGMLLRKHNTQQDLLDAVTHDVLEELQSMEDIIGDLDINPL